MENIPSSNSPNEDTHEPQQTDPDIPPQTTKESALQKSNMEDNRPTKSNKLSYQETHEKGRQNINAMINKHVERSVSLGKKKREVEAEVKQLFESIKQEIHNSSEYELFGIILSEVETHPIEWLWQGRLPLGKITILDGDPGIGKSLIAINISACVSTGKPMPDGTPGIQGGAIIISPEDSAEDTIKPRFEAAGGDPSQVMLFNTIECFDEKRMGIFEYPFSLSRDLQDLEKTIKRRNAKLVVLDPLMAVLGVM